MKPHQHLRFAFLFLVFLSAIATTSAQRGQVRRAIEKDMEHKYADSQRTKGREELKKVTYENDKRYKDPTNKVQATLVFEHKDLNKKGEVKRTMVQKMIFGKTGECIVSDEGSKNESWMIYNYADKANYMVNVRDKRATKMPLINMQKMAEASAKKDAENRASNDGWKNTGETQVINGYNCTLYKYTYTKDYHNRSFDAWISKDVKVDLGDNYMMGARLSEYKYKGSATSKDVPNGFMVRMVTYDKNGVPVSQRDLKAYSLSADEKYFDLSQFKITDVMSVL
jgi:hypothetical protein